MTAHRPWPPPRPPKAPRPSQAPNAALRAATKPAPRWTSEIVEGAREATTLAGTLGGQLRATRIRRRMTAERLAERVGITPSRLRQLERGEGANAPLVLWVKLGIALKRPLAVSFSRDLDEGGVGGSGAGADGPRDAGHLAAQELVLRLARAHGRRANVELPTRPLDPAAWIDTVLRDDPARALIIVEIVNRAGDVGAAARNTDRKVSDLQGFAILAGGDGEPYRVASGWLLVETAANRRLVAGYPEVLRRRFPGSSWAWARALMEGAEPPAEPAVAWIDPRSGRIYPIRWRS